MQKHTEGPFSIGQDCTNLMDKDCRSENSRFVAIDAPGHGALAIVVVRMEDDEADNQRLMGNLSLLAAAPDLLAQLRTVVFHLKRGDFKNNDSLTEQAITSIEKTIDQATGGAQ